MKILAPILLLLTLVSPTALALKVVTSVTPLQLIANEILGDRGNAMALIDPRESPHRFQLKPSQLRKISEADVLIWISDHFETGLARLHGQLPASTRRLQLAELLSAERLIGHDHELDGHLWLSPAAVADLVDHIARQLAEIDPPNAATYHDNAHDLRKRIDAWLKKARDAFTDSQPAYLLDHNFLAYLERDLGLSNHGALRDSHDHGGSMRHLSHLHEELRGEHAHCLLIDRLPASNQARQVAAQHGLRILAIPVLGDSASMRSIVDLYQGIIERLHECR